MNRRTFLKALTAVAAAAMLPRTAPTGFRALTYKGRPLHVDPHAQRIYFLNPQTLRFVHDAR